MATRADREAMAAALGGMVSRPEAETPSGKENPVAADEVRAVAPVTPIPAVAPNPNVATEDPPPAPSESEYRRTGTGYVKTDGTELVRTVVMMTESERRRLKIEAVNEGLSASDYVRRALGFLPEK